MGDSFPFYFFNLPHPVSLALGKNGNHELNVVTTNRHKEIRLSGRFNNSLSFIEHLLLLSI